MEPTSQPAASVGSDRVTFIIYHWVTGGSAPRRLRALNDGPFDPQIANSERGADEVSVVPGT